MTTELAQIIDQIVKDDDLHAQWLNTLSMMENTGARKISASENKTKVTLIQLKHAAEEARHAYYLKKQIGRLRDENLYHDYEPENLLSPFESLHYLLHLDVEISRYLKNEVHLRGDRLKFGAYLLVTYAIELRAGELYPVYQEVLIANHSKVTVKTIIAEEETHLEEMLSQMKEFFGNKMLDVAAIANKIEKRYYQKWILALEKEVNIERIELLS